MESNGPETKVRGPAAHIYERYLQLARDAASSGDRVLSENYLQHADHYFRMVRAMQPAVPLQPSGDRFGSPEGDYEGDEEGGPELDGGDVEGAPGEGEEPREMEQAEGGQQQQQGFEREGGDFRRRRGRRNRFRPGGEGEGSGEPRPEGGGERQDRGERPERSEQRFERRERREPREPREQRGGGDDQQEGFSDSPRPAFLRSD